MQRTAEITRKTKETNVTLSLNLDGSGTGSASTGVGFFDHMLDLLTRHSLIDLTVDGVASRDGACSCRYSTA